MALINCPNCGKQISDKAANCIGCGFALASVRKCEECGEILPSGASSCPNCGCPVEDNAAETVQPATAPQSTPAPAPQPAPVTQPIPEPAPASAPQPAPVVQSAPKPAPSAPKTSDKWICGECGTINERSFCKNCNASSKPDSEIYVSASEPLAYASRSSASAARPAPAPTAASTYGQSAPSKDGVLIDGDSGKNTGHLILGYVFFILGFLGLIMMFFGVTGIIMLFAPICIYLGSSFFSSYNGCNIRVTADKITGKAFGGKDVYLPISNVHSVTINNKNEIIIQFVNDNNRIKKYTFKNLPNANNVYNVLNSLISSREQRK